MSTRQRPQRQTRKPVNYASFEGSGSEEEEEEDAAALDDSEDFVVDENDVDEPFSMADCEEDEMVKTKKKQTKSTEGAAGPRKRTPKAKAENEEKEVKPHKLKGQATPSASKKRKRTEASIKPEKETEHKSQEKTSLGDGSKQLPPAAVADDEGEEVCALGDDKKQTEAAPSDVDDALEEERPPDKETETAEGSKPKKPKTKNVPSGAKKDPAPKKRKDTKLQPAKALPASSVTKTQSSPTPLPNSSAVVGQTTPVRRVGLSRRAGVKPLHPK